MTNQDAIKTLHELWRETNDSWYQETYNLAISALKAQDVPDTNVGNTVSRTNVIDTEGLDEQIRCEMCRNPMHTNRGCDGNCIYDVNLYKRIMQILGERIKPLPPAHSEIAKDTNVPTNDLIRRQDAIEHLKKRLYETALNNDTDYTYYEEIADNRVDVWMNEVPSEQSEHRWIPCSERLPKEKDTGILKKLGIEKRSEYVFATVEVKGERITAIVCTLDGKWHWKMRYAFPDFKVIAWMTMPAPYGTEGRTDEQ